MYRKVLFTTSLVTALAISNPVMATDDSDAGCGCWKGFKQTVSRIFNPHTMRAVGEFVNFSTNFAFHLDEAIHDDGNFSLSDLASTLSLVQFNIPNLTNAGKSFAEGIRDTSLSWSEIGDNLSQITNLVQDNEQLMAWLEEYQDTKQGKVIRDILDVSTILTNIHTGRDNKGHKIKAEKAIKEIGRERLASIMDNLEQIRQLQAQL